MKNDTRQALRLLDSRGYTCVVCKDGTVFTASQRGVRPLLDWLDSGTDLHDFCAADKVVGRATAFLYILLGVTEVYAHVMSRPAADVLTAHGISAHAETYVDGIINRTGTGPCPFEAAVLATEDPAEALAAIRSKMRQMTGGN